jgi:hypothetical protein
LPDFDTFAPISQWQYHFAEAERNQQPLSRSGYFLALQVAAHQNFPFGKIHLRYATTRHIFPDRENTP